jgi:hypothetical protein
MMESTPIREEPASTPEACPRCGTIDTPVISPGVGPHWRSLRCRHCDRVWRWISRYTLDEREARRLAAREQAMRTKPPTPAQLEYLRTLGDRDTPPVSMLAASQRINILLQNEVAP